MSDYQGVSDYIYNSNYQTFYGSSYEYWRQRILDAGNLGQAQQNYGGLQQAQANPYIMLGSGTAVMAPPVAPQVVEDEIGWLQRRVQEVCWQEIEPDVVGERHQALNPLEQRRCSDGCRQRNRKIESGAHAGTVANPA